MAPKIKKNPIFFLYFYLVVQREVFRERIFLIIFDEMVPFNFVNALVKHCEIAKCCPKTSHLLLRSKVLTKKDFVNKVLS